MVEDNRRRRTHTETQETQEATGPRFAKGEHMFERLVRSGPPLGITLRGLPRKRQPRLSIEAAMAARPQVVEK